MKISVWDTYVQREDGKTMHFDILVPDNLTDTTKIFNFGKSYLSEKKFKTGELTSKECNFCHISVAPQEVVNAIAEKGFSIIEMENCY
ncbi:DUF2024 family protein [Aquimarina sp. AU474]|uniref:DUF2024 family protein n=1 Tax=Aquimarina sp. AU474 TaxID=2108529 RepID=UPI000D686B41|nr:DUF2024 family protein [Aquimarina sp. AU474]